MQKVTYKKILISRLRILHVSVFGFSTIELLFAFSIATIFLSGAALVAFSGQTAGLDVALTRGGIHTAYTQLQDAIAVTQGDWGSSITPVAVDFYAQANSASLVSPCVKSLTSDATWTTEHARDQYATFGTYVGSADIARALGGGCDPFPPSDAWDNPDSFGSVDVSGSSGTGLAVRSIGGTPYAFVTADPAPLNGDDFIVIDVHDAENPDVSGTPLSTFVGLNDIALGSNYAYVLNNENTEQLRVIDVSNPTVPAEIISAIRSLPNINSTCSPASSPCLSGRSIAYYAGRIYIGTSYIAFGNAGENHELHVYCVDDKVTVGCSPQTPVWLGSYNVNHNVNDIALETRTISGTDKTLAYLALSSTNTSNPELRVFDVTNPSTITSISSFNPAGTHYGQTITLLGDYAYFGRDRATGSNNDLFVLSLTNPTALTVLSETRLGIANNTYVSGIAVQGTFAFVATTDSNAPLFIYNVTNPSALVAVSACDLNFSQVTRRIVYQDNLVFTVNRSNDLLRILYDQPSVCI